MSAMVKNTSEGLKVLRASMITCPRPYPTPVDSATSTTIQAPNILRRRTISRPRRIAGPTTPAHLCHLKKQRDQDHEDGRRVADAEHENRDRKPSDRRHRRQQRDSRQGELLHHKKITHRHADAH